MLYDAKGSYNFLYTRNTWANDGLKAAGQKLRFGRQGFWNLPAL